MPKLATIGPLCACPGVHPLLFPDTTKQAVATRILPLAILLILSALLPASAQLSTETESATTNRISELSLAARKGDAEAQFALAEAYFQGHGLPRNPENALKWYERAAGNGHAQSQLFLAHLHYQGLHTPRNPDLAVHWWQKAADNGNANAQLALAMFFMNRSESEQDLAAANNWLQKAASGGHAKAKELVQLYGSDSTDTAPEPEKPEPVTPAVVQATTQTLILARPHVALSPETQNDNAWIFSQNPAYLTLQLASFVDHQLSTEFLSRFELDTGATRFIRSADNRWTYALLGVYSNEQQAQEAAAALPPGLTPWTRTFGSIQTSRCLQLKTISPEAYQDYCE